MMKPELLAPAGNETMLHAAVSAGADAVYLGMGDFNARRNADNFDASSFERACEYAHLRGVRIYVALNTIVLPSEVKSAVECAKKCDRIGADGFIVADIGLACAIKSAIPDACLHISTQMNVHSIDGLLACAALGAMRVTLARELSIREIASICEVARSLDIEVETFLHGALCFCYSGQCLMSSMIGGRSANRGLCAQPCRLPYELIDESGNPVSTMPGAHLLSPKDLCGLDSLPALIESGVSSLKIEGRMKSPEYVFTAVSVYRREIDRICASVCTDAAASNGKRASGAGHSGDCLPMADADDALESSRGQLESVFSRGFTSGYLKGDRSNAIMGYARPNNRGQFAGRIKRVDGSRLSIDPEIDIVEGDVLQAWTKRGNVTIEVTGVESPGGSAITLEYSVASDLSRSKASMQVGDRVFRIRSKDAEFRDDPAWPAVPVRCHAELPIGKPLIVRFEVAPPIDARDLPDSASVANAISHRLLDESAGDAIAAGEGRDCDANSVNDERADHASALSFSFKGADVEPARTKPVSVEDVAEHIGRMGGSDFELVSIDVDLDEDAGIGFSQLHKARKRALEGLKDEILSSYRRPMAQTAGNPIWLQGYESSAKWISGRASQRESVRASQVTADDFKIYALATNPDCARAARRAGASGIYIPAYDYKRGCSTLQGCPEDLTRQGGYPKGCIPYIPSILHDKLDDRTRFDASAQRNEMAASDIWELAKSGSPLLVGSIGGLYHANAIGAIPHVSSSLPIANPDSVKVAAASGAELIWLSPELELKQIEQIAHESGDMADLGLCVNGYQELMVSEHCVLMSMGECSQDCESCPRRRKRHFLRDRKGYEFPVHTDASGRSHIMNSIEYDVIHAIRDLMKSGIKTYLVDATLMTPEECAQRVGRLSKAIDLAIEGKSLDKVSGRTTGHLFREVL